VGQVQNPSLSGRGETAGVFDLKAQREAFVFLDTAGQEPTNPGLGVAVSGDGCIALWARNNGSTNFADAVSIGVTDRCQGGDRELFRTNSGYQPGGGLALSFTGQFGVVVLQPQPGAVALPSTVVRVDTTTGAQLAMPANGFPYFGFDANLGVDISDNGNVVVAVESGQAISATGAPFGLRDVLAWDVPSNTTAPGSLRSRVTAGSSRSHLPKR
jgi:hypothetical protein